MANILLTGGAGFIGSHTAVELLEAGHDVIIADDLSNSSIQAVDNIQVITGKKPAFHLVNVCSRQELEPIFQQYTIDAVIHFAGFKAVGESVAKPISYYRNNLDSTLTLLELMAQYQVKTIVFSSSATVYGTENTSPLAEGCPTGCCTNPYGWTKFMIEQMLHDLVVADESYSVMLLRYFNPVGAHASGLIGEKPNGIPNNLMPYVAQVATGQREQLSVFGGDYPTHDGTGVRDYIHVVDLAKGHLAALDYGLHHNGCQAVNLGTGIGYSVLDMVHAFEEANQVKIPYIVAPRRSGDIATCYSNPEKAKALLGWTAEKNLVDMCKDTWHWEQSYQK